MLQAVHKHRGLLVCLAFLVGTVVACGDEDGDGTDPGTAPEDDPGSTAEADPGTTTEPDPAPEPQGDVVLREISSCDEAAGPLGAYLSDFELYDSQVVPGDDRYSCEWRRPADPDGWDLGIILVGHYTNTPDFASNDWEAAGFTYIDDPRVEPFNGLAIQTEPGLYRAVNVMGSQFDAQLQVVALRGQEPDHIPVDDAVGILLDLTES